LSEAETKTWNDPPSALKPRKSWFT